MRNIFLAVALLFVGFIQPTYAKADVQSNVVIKDIAAVGSEIEKGLKDELANLSDQIGYTETKELITAVRDGLNIEMPLDINEMKTLVSDQAEQLGISLTEEQLNQLSNSFMEIKNIEINWDGIYDGIQNAVSSEKGQTFVEGIIEGVKSIVNAFLSLF
ncbi:MAG: DUF1002 domain-containing protein [Bacillaceae bacterium]